MASTTDTGDERAGVNAHFEDHRTTRLSVVVVDCSGDHQAFEISLRSATRVVGAAHVVAACTADTESVAMSMGLRSVVADGTWLDGLDSALPLVTSKLALVVDSTQLVLASAIDAIEHSVDHRHVAVRLDADARADRLDDTILTRRGPAAIIVPGTVVRPAALPPGRPIIEAVLDAVAAGWTVAASDRRAATPHRDISPATQSDQRRAVALGALRALTSTGGHAGSAVRGLRRELRFHVVGGAVHAVTTLALATVVVLGGARLLTAPSIAASVIAAAGAAFTAAGRSPWWRVSMAAAHIDVSLRALIGLGVRGRATQTHRIGWRSSLQRPMALAVTTALEMAIVVRCVSFATEPRRAAGHVVDLALLAVAACWLIPLLLSIRVVALARPRRTSTRAALACPVMVDDRPGRLHDMSATGLGIDLRRSDADAIADAATVVTEVSFRDEPTCLVTRVARRSTQGPLVLLGLAIDRVATLPDDLDRLERRWAEQLDRLRTVEVRSRRHVRVGGHPLARAAAAVTVVSLSTTVLPPYPASFADTPPPAVADSTWWVKNVSAPGDIGDGLPATAATIWSTGGGTYDDAGNLYYADRYRNRIRRVTPAGVITTFAGNGFAGFSGDGGPAINAELNNPNDVAWHAGSLYIVDFGNHRIRRVAANGTISTVAGNGVNLGPTSGMFATSTPLGNPYAIDVDNQGRLVISRWHSIVRLEADRTITVLAGSSSAGFAGDGGPATAALFNTPRDVAVASDGSILVTDFTNHRVRRFTPGGTVTTIAGTGTAGFSGDGGPATAAQLRNPVGVDTLPDGTIVVSDASNHRIRTISPAGTISTVAGTGVQGQSGDGGAATEARIANPWGLWLSPAGAVQFVQDQNRIRSFTIGGTIATTAGDSTWGITAGTGGPVGAATFDTPHGMTIGPDGSIYVAEQLGHVVRRIAPDGTVTLVAGAGVSGYAGDGGAAISARLSCPRDVALGPDGSLYIAEECNHRIRRVSPEGTITTFAGNGTAGFLGDGGPATAARINAPRGVAVAPDGTVFIADTSNHRIRRVSTAGVITTIAGTTIGFSGDGGPATAAQLNAPFQLALRGTDVLVADTNNNRIRRIDASGTITTIAGTGAAIVSGDGGPATTAGLGGPMGVVVAPDGSLWVPLTTGRVRRIDASGTISSILGSQVASSPMEGVPALLAQTSRISDIVFRADGTPVMSDPFVSTITQLVPPPGSVSDVVLTGTTADTATVSWTPPPTPPFPITGYEVTVDPPVRTQVTGTSATLLGLHAGFTYQVSVRARVGRATTNAATATVSMPANPDEVRPTIVQVAGALVTGDSMPAATANIVDADGIAEDPAGNLYVSSLEQIWRITPDGIATVIAGDGPPGTGIIGFSGDGGPARSARFLRARGLAWRDGVLYVADNGNHRIRAILPDGTITTVAGNGTATWTGDGQQALANGFNGPNDVAFDTSGRLLVTLGSAQRIVRIDTDGTATSIAGTGVKGTTPSGGQATAANLDNPGGIAVGADGRIWFTEIDGRRVRSIAPDGALTTVAGTGATGLAGDGGPATAAQLSWPWDVALDATGAVLIADSNRLRRIGPDGTITTIAGTGGGLPEPLVGPATTIDLPALRHVLGRADGSIVMNDLSVGRTIELRDGTLRLIAGDGEPELIEGAAALQSPMGGSNSFAVTDTGDLLVAIENGYEVRRIRLDGTTTRYAGTGTPGYLGTTAIPPGPATSYGFLASIGIIDDGAGGAYIGDRVRVIHVDAAGQQTVVAGNGGWTLDPNDGIGGPATAARFGHIRALALDDVGRLYIADSQQFAIRRVELDGTLTLVAGTGVSGYNGDDRPATTATMREPSNLEFDDEGRLWFSDRQNHRLRMIDHDGMIRTMAGTGMAGVDADGLPATESRLNEPYGFAFLGDRVIIANYGGNRLSAIEPDGTMRTIAGTGVKSWFPEATTPLGDPLTTMVSGPVAVEVLPSGAIIWTEWETRRIRAIPGVLDPVASLTIDELAGSTAVLHADVTLRAGENLSVSVEPAATPAIDGDRLTLRDLVPGTSYRVTVRVSDRVGVSAPVTITLTAPVDLDATPASTVPPVPPVPASSEPAPTAAPTPAGQPSSTSTPITPITPIDPGAPDVLDVPGGGNATSTATSTLAAPSTGGRAPGPSSGATSSASPTTVSRPTSTPTSIRPGSGESPSPSDADSAAGRQPAAGAEEQSSWSPVRVQFTPGGGLTFTELEPASELVIVDSQGEALLELVVGPDGRIATDEATLRELLGPGTHRLEITAVTSGGTSISQDITVVIEAPAPPGAPDRSLPVAIAAAIGIAVSAIAVARRRRTLRP